MRLATEASALAPEELDRLLTDIRQTPMEPHALRQQAVLAFGRRATTQPPLAVLMRDGGRVVGDVHHGGLGGAGELQGNSLAISVHALSGEETSATPREHRCSASDTTSMAAFALRTGIAVVSSNLATEP